MPDHYIREARRWQLLIAFVFLGLGGWCLVAPMTVIELTVRPEHQNDLRLTAITIGAFGAQAMLVGLVSATSRFTARTFLALGLAMLPFFVFDWWFYAVEPLFNALILLDVAGNLAMLAACLRGWWLLGPGDRGATHQ
jgi:FtsH-binding integral membrane protein